MGWEDEASLYTWYGAVEVHAPAYPFLFRAPKTTSATAKADEENKKDDLADLIRPKTKPDTDKKRRRRETQGSKREIIPAPTVENCRRPGL